MPSDAGMPMDDLVTQTSGGMPDRVAALSTPSSASMDLLAQLTDLQQQQIDMAQAREDVPTMRDDLLTPEGILSMLGMGLGAASGNRDLAAGGAGMLKGFMGQGRGDAAQQMQSIQQGEETLVKAMDAKRRQLTTMLQTQPDMFLDPETGLSVVDPRLLGIAATGFMIPINPAVNRLLKEKSMKQNTLVEMGMNYALNGETPEAKRMGVQMVGASIGVQFSPEVLEAYESQDDMAIWEALLRMPGLLTANTLAAMNHWMENPDLSIRESPELVSMLQADVTSRADGTKYTVDDHYLNLLQQWNMAYSAQPEAFEGMDDYEQIAAIFGTNPGNEALLKEKLDKDDPFGVGISAKDFQANMQSLGEWMVKFWEFTEGKGRFFSDRDITSTEDIWEHAGAVAVEMLPIMKRIAKENGARNRGQAMALMTEYFAGKDATLGSYAVAASKAREALDQLVAQNTVAGVFMVDEFNKAVLEFIRDTGEE